MGEIQVRAKYTSPWAKMLLYGLLALIPVWGVISPIAFLLLSFVLCMSPSAFFYNPILTFGMAACFVVTTVSCALACIALADNSLIASKDGLRIPCHTSLTTKLRRDFRWSEISNVVFSSADPNAPQFFISFKTVSGLSFDIFAFRLSKPELERFLLGIELWCNPTVVDTRLPQIKESLQQHLAIADSANQSYTAMWEDELERRFNSTAFVVLEPEETLQDGKISIVRQLSFGGLSAVYLCQIDKRDLFVLKESVVPADSSAELIKKAEEMFAREAKFLLRLEHQNIVKVLDHFVEKGRNYLRLEHINGPDLRQFVKINGAQPEYRVLEWARKLAEVMAYLHAQEPPIIHRDLTPDNIVLENNSRIKVIDFGAANEYIGTATGTLIGKQSYLPMEQLRGKSVPQSDIYSFGCTLHFLLTGEDPEPLEVSRPRQRNAAISEKLDNLVAACTDQDFKNRPASAREIIAMLEREASPVV